MSADSLAQRLAELLIVAYAAFFLWAVYSVYG